MTSLGRLTLPPEPSFPGLAGAVATTDRLRVRRSSVAIEKDWLVFSGEGRGVVVSTNRLLDDARELAGGPAKALQFVRRYGPLFGQFIPTERPLDPQPISHYTTLGRELNSFTRLLFDARAGRGAQSAAWDELGHLRKFRAYQNRDAWDAILSWLNLRWPGDRLFFVQDEEQGVKLELQGEVLLSSIVLLWVREAAGSQPLAECSGCGTIFTPRRKPATGRRSYCNSCGTGQGYRHSSRLAKRKARAKSH